jgi:hypothetical protein
MADVILLLRCAPAPPGGPLALEALDQHGVIGEGRRVVKEAAQQLIVVGGPDTELAPDGLLLGPGVAPPLALEREHAPVTLPQRPGSATHPRNHWFRGA